MVLTKLQHKSHWVDSNASGTRGKPHFNSSITSALRNISVNLLCGFGNIYICRCSKEANNWILAALFWDYLHYAVVVADKSIIESFLRYVRNISIWPCRKQVWTHSMSQCITTLFNLFSKTFPWQWMENLCYVLDFSMSISLRVQVTVILYIHNVIWCQSYPYN